MDYFEQKRLIEFDVQNVKIIKKIDKRLHRCVLNENFEYISYLKNVDELLIEECIKTDSHDIQYLDNPSEKVQFIAINGDIESCQWIKNPTNSVLEYLIEHGQWPSDANINSIDPYLQLKALKLEPSLIGEITNLTPEFIEQAFEVEPGIVEHIPNPSLEMIKIAISRDGWMLRMMNDKKYAYLYEEYALIALNNNGMVLQQIKNPTQEMMKIAVRNNPNVIRYIPNPSFEIQMLAVSIDPNMIEKIKDPHPDVQWATVSRDVYVSIKKPSEKVITFRKFIGTKEYKPALFGILSEILPNLQYLIPETKFLPGVLQLTVKTGIPLNFGDPDIEFRYGFAAISSY